MGEELAKIALYYGLIDNIESTTQKVVCPFHGDVNASMKLNFEDGSFYCFGCHIQGNSQEFCKWIEERNGNKMNDFKFFQFYFKALRSDKVSNIKLKTIDPKKRKTRNDQLFAEAKDYYYGLATTDWCGDFSQEAIYVKEYMNNRGFTKKALTKTQAKLTFNKNYPIIFPLLDNGEFKGWVTRTTTKRIEEKRKYLYSEGFSRATTLAGNYGDKEFVFVVEGYMDRLKFLQFGIPNCVAILGWKITTDQIQKLKSKGIKTVISALDNDECGKKGTEELSKHFEVIRFSFLKGVKDPGEMTKEIFKKCYIHTMNKYKQRRQENECINKNQI